MRFETARPGIFISVSVLNSNVGADTVTGLRSQAATVAQDLGSFSVKIDYCRPGVKGRKIWGELVPFGEVWRRVDRSVAEIVERADLASIARDWAEKRRAHTYDWEI